MKSLPLCAFCGKKLAAKHCSFIITFDIIGRPVVAWHNTSPVNEVDCATKDKAVAELYELFLLQEKFKMDNNNPLKPERLPHDFMAQVVKLVKKVHKRGKNRVRMVKNKFWNMDEKKKRKSLGKKKQK